MITAQFRTGAETYAPQRLPVVPYKLGIIKQDFDFTDTGMTITVQARKMNDTPKIGSKGDVMVVSDKWYGYMKKLMTQKAWEWWGVIPFYLMINRHSKWSEAGNTEMPKFECIALPNNFITADYFVNGFAHVIARDSRNFNTDVLNPEVDNWFYKPWQFWKCTAHNDNGEVFLVGASLHVYSPVIREEADIYIQENFVEWFPPLPMNVTYQGNTHMITGYCLKGASVYGHAETMDIPLRLARVPGELLHPCPEWILRELPVPVEVRKEWV